MAEDLARDGALRKKVPVTLQIAIMMMPLLNMGIAIITPALATISANFPDLPQATVNLISTMPNLVIMPFAIIAGIVTGRGALTYRKVCLATAVLWTVAGLMPMIPAVSANFGLVLLSRALFGVAEGFVFPMGQMLVYNYVKYKEQRPRVIANNSLSMNIGGCIYQYAGGALVMIAWNYVFLAHLIGVVAFIIMFIWLKDPDGDMVKPSEDIEEEEAEQTEKLSIGQSFAKIPGFMWLLIIFYGLSIVLNTPLTMNLSQHIMDLGGEPTLAATVLIVYTVAGIIMGFIFPYVYKLLKRFSIPVGILIEALGYICMFFMNSVVGDGIGMFLQGAGLLIFMPALQEEIGLFCPRGADDTASGLMMCAMNFGMFFGGFWAAFAPGIVGQTNGMYAWIVSAVGLLILVVIVFLVHLKDRPEFHIGEE